MSAVIRWEEPPPPARRHARRRFASWAIADELRQNPGRWALVAENPANTGITSHISSAYFDAFSPPGSFEAHWRTVDGQRLVYARYVGEPSPEVQR